MIIYLTFVTVSEVISIILGAVIGACLYRYYLKKAFDRVMKTYEKKGNPDFKVWFKGD